MTHKSLSYFLIIQFSALKLLLLLIFLWFGLKMPTQCGQICFFAPQERHYALIKVLFGMEKYKWVHLCLANLVLISERVGRGTPQNSRFGQVCSIFPHGAPISVKFDMGAYHSFTVMPNFSVISEDGAYGSPQNSIIGHYGSPKNSIICHI